ncbi:hypothetical protein [Candidatus Pyrohabitans sp.]
MKIRLTIAELFTLLDASYAPGKKGKRCTQVVYRSVNNRGRET